MDDISAGMSGAYREWRIEKGLPVIVPPQADQQRPRNLELLLANAQQEIERLNVHLRDVKTLHQESKEAMQGWLNEKDALLRSKDQEIQRLRMEGRNSGGQRQRLTSANRRTQSLGMQLAAAKDEASTQRRRLETANSRITHLENQLAESPGVQALETELANANTRAFNAEENNRHLEGRLRDANTRLTSIQSQQPGQEQPSLRIPDGRLGELASMYAKLARELLDLPVSPQGLQNFDVRAFAIEIAPLLLRDWAKEKLQRFLASSLRGWHCLETIIDGVPEAKGIHQNQCLDHKTDCPFVRVLLGRSGPELDFCSE